jgi:hypothetical protein
MGSAFLVGARFFGRPAMASSISSNRLAPVVDTCQSTVCRCLEYVMAITKCRFFIGQSERKSAAVRPMEGIKRKTIQERGDPRIGRSWHYPELRCGAAIQPRY